MLERNGKGYMGTKKIQNEKDDARYKKEVEIKELMVEEGRDRENCKKRLKKKDCNEGDEEEDKNVMVKKRKE